MGTILKVTPEKVLKTVEELNYLSFETKEIITRYKLLLDEMDLAWEGEVQSCFRIEVLSNLESMKKLVNMCDDYSEEIVKIAEHYRNTESSFVNDIANSLLADIIL